MSELIFWNFVGFNFCQIGHLKKGINPPSYSELAFSSQYLAIAIKTGVVTSIIALAVSTEFEISNLEF